MHKLLIRQLKHLHLNSSGSVTLTAEDWETLLANISESYTQLDKGAELLERSLKLASNELFERNTDLRKKIHELKINESLISHQAKHDALTELPNRFYYIDQLDRLLAQECDSGTSAILFIDLDKFKYINDTHGHQFGDELLCIMTKRLKGWVRENDFLARFGGDEFVALLNNINDLETVEKIADRFRNEVNKPFKIRGIDFEISASIGISLYPKDGSDRETLIRKADIAMYKAKEAGRNNIKFYASSFEKPEEVLTQVTGTAELPPHPLN